MLGTENLNALYQDTILDHYKNPRGLKELDSFDCENKGFNPICGDKVTIKAKFNNEYLEDLTVNSSGCAISVASGSMLAELLPGKSLEEVKKISEAFRELMQGKEMPEDIDYGDLDTLEGVQKYHVRIKCALLAWVTLKDLIKSWQEKISSNATSTTEEKE